MRVIKKYPNRRLYDATASRYVTLGDIRQLVLDDTPFRVIERKTDADITRTILLQVIAEQEQHGPALFSERFLAQVIRAYRSSAAPRVKDVLERSLEQSMAAERAAGQSEVAGA